MKNKFRWVRRSSTMAWGTSERITKWGSQEKTPPHKMAEIVSRWVVMHHVRVKAIEIVVGGEDMILKKIVRWVGKSSAMPWGRVSVQLYDKMGQSGKSDTAQNCRDCVKISYGGL